MWGATARGLSPGPELLREVQGTFEQLDVGMGGPPSLQAPQEKAKVPRNGGCLNSLPLRRPTRRGAVEMPGHPKGRRAEARASGCRNHTLRIIHPRPASCLAVVPLLPPPSLRPALCWCLGVLKHTQTPEPLPSRSGTQPGPRGQSWWLQNPKSSHEATCKGQKHSEGQNYNSYFEFP